MTGRVKRKAGLAAAALAPATAPPACALCQRPLGTRTEWHHLIPKSEGGTEMVALHPICHRAIHAAAPNVELARRLSSIAALRAHPRIAKFLGWIADKPADFHAPTRSSGRAR